jgi:hypothetical protein
LSIVAFRGILVDIFYSPREFYLELLKLNYVTAEVILSDHLSHNIKLYSPEFYSIKAGKMVDIFLTDSSGNATNLMTKGRKILSKNNDPNLFIVRTIGYSYLIQTTNDPRKLKVVKAVRNNY